MMWHLRLLFVSKACASSVRAMLVRSTGAVQYEMWAMRRSCVPSLVGSRLLSRSPPPPRRRSLSSVSLARGRSLGVASASGARAGRKMLCSHSSWRRLRLREPHAAPTVSSDATNSRAQRTGASSVAAAMGHHERHEYQCTTAAARRTRASALLPRSPALVSASPGCRTAKSESESESERAREREERGALASVTSI